MKISISILILSCISYLGYSQIDVIQAPGNDGTTLMLNNSNNFDWKIWNDASNYWGHTNTLDFVHDDGYLLLQLYPDKHVNINGRLDVDYRIALHMEDKGTKAGASGFDFNTASSYEGMILEQSYSEGSGFYGDGDFAVIWSPGDQGRLLRVYDEDGMVEKWYLDGSGYAHTSSDRNKKENIKNIYTNLVKLKNIEGVKFNYKKEDITTATDINIVKNSQKSRTDTVGTGDVEYIDNNKYDPSQKQYFGFIAQDVEKIYPNLVNTNERGEKFISYTEFIPLLVEGYKEQQAIIEERDGEIVDLTKRVEELEIGIQKIYSLLKTHVSPK